LSTARQLTFDFESVSVSPAAALESAFRRVHRQLKPRTTLPTIQTEFFPSAGANHSATLEEGVLNVRVSDLFHDATPDIFETLATILLSKLYKKKIDPEYNRKYRRYTMSEPMLERSRHVRSERGRRTRTTGSGGRHYDLAPLFEDINAQYFESSLRKPELSWTGRKTRSVMGRYDFDQDVIFVSKSLDTGEVPEYVLRYILFHEMLHVKHGTEIRDDREIVHTSEFRREEREYEFYDAATAWLKEN
jgi:predicted metal-dependent hydrolase